MAALVVVCYIVAVVLAGISAANVPSPRVSLLSAAVAFIALGLALQSWGGMGG